MLPYVTDLDANRAWPPPFSYGKCCFPSWRKPAILFLSSFFLATMPAQSYASHPLERFCHNQPQELSYWVNYFDSILVGKAIKVAPQYKSSEVNNGFCWALIEVDDWLKGEGPDQIWVQSGINTHRVTNEDLQNLTYCEFENGNTYVIYGHLSKSENPNLPKERIITSRGLGKPAMSYCAPNTPLNNTTDKDLVNAIKMIINKGR